MNTPAAKPETSAKAILLQKAHKHVAAGNFEAAIDEYQKAESLIPHDYNLQIQLADLLIRANRTEDACPILSNVAEHFRLNQSPWKAIAILNRLLRLVSNPLPVLMRLTELYTQQDLKREAMHYLKTGIHQMLKISDIPGVIEAYLMWIRIEPWNIRVRMEVIQAYLSTGMLEEAKHQEREIDALVAFYFKERDWERARECLVLLQSLNPHQPQYLTKLEELARITKEETTS